MRRLIKFLHTMGAIGFMGALACLLVLAWLAPPPASLAGYALMRSAMATIAAWVVFPSLVLTLIPGLLAIAVAPAFHEAGWAWIKAATGILIFAGGLHALAPIQEEAYTSIPYVPLGQFTQPIAFRSNIKGVLVAGVPVYWNIEKT